MKFKLYSLYLLHILSDGFQSVLLLLLPFLAVDLSIDIVQIGLLGTILHLMSIFFAIPAGIWAVKHGGFRILTLSVLLFGLGFMIISFAGSYPLLIITFILSGIGFAVFPPIGLALVAKLHEPSERVKGISEFGAIGDLGRVAVTATVSYLVAFLGWRITSSVYGVICLIAFLFLFWAFFFKFKETKAEEEKPFKIKELAGLLKNKLFVAATASASIDTLASSQLFVFYLFYYFPRVLTQFY